MIKLNGAWPVMFCDQEAEAWYRYFQDDAAAPPDVRADESPNSLSSVWLAGSNLSAHHRIWPHKNEHYWFEATIFFECIAEMDVAARQAHPHGNNGPRGYAAAFVALHEAGECVQSVAPLYSGPGAGFVLVHTRLLPIGSIASTLAHPDRYAAGGELA
jgi:hypothetical protein